MAEISREEAIEKIKQTPVYRYECELEEDSQSDLCKALCKAISDMENLERKDSTRPIDLINEFGDLDAEKFNKISHWFSQAQKLEKIGQISSCGNCRKLKDDCWECMSDKLDYIEQIVKGESSWL